jgi:hypothetical protein
MVEDTLSRRRCRTAQTLQDDAGSAVNLEPDDGSVAASPAAQPRCFRTEAEELERLAWQVSLMPDRQYFLSCARELRAKAATLESESAPVGGDPC